MPSWKIILGAALLLILIGRLADYMYGWLWSRGVSKALWRRSNQFLDLHFTKLVHDDVQVARRQLDDLFGKGLFGRRFLWITLTALLSYGLAGLLVEAMAKDIPVGIEGTVSLLLMVFFTSISNMVSLATTKYLLSKSRPTIRRLSAVLSFDALIAYFLMGLPWWLGGLYLMRSSISFAWALRGTLIYVFLWPFAIRGGFLLHNDFSFQSWFNFFGVALMCAGAAIPSVFHLYLVGRDLLQRLLLRWIYLGLANIFAELAESRRPLTIILGGVGGLIAILKLFLDP